MSEAKKYIIWDCSPSFDDNRQSQTVPMYDQIALKRMNVFEEIKYFKGMILNRNYYKTRISPGSYDDLAMTIQWFHDFVPNAMAPIHRDEVYTQYTYDGTANTYGNKLVPFDSVVEREKVHEARKKRNISHIKSFLLKAVIPYIGNPAWPMLANPQQVELQLLISITRLSQEIKDYEDEYEQTLINAISNIGEPADYTNNGETKSRLTKKIGISDDAVLTQKIAGNDYIINNLPVNVPENDLLFQPVNGVLKDFLISELTLPLGNENGKIENISLP